MELTAQPESQTKSSVAEAWHCSALWQSIEFGPTPMHACSQPPFGQYHAQPKIAYPAFTIAPAAEPRRPKEKRTERRQPAARARREPAAG
jgi:hypothetical protein